MAKYSRGTTVINFLSISHDDDHELFLPPFSTLIGADVPPALSSLAQQQRETLESALLKLVALHAQRRKAREEEGRALRGLQGKLEERDALIHSLTGEVERARKIGRDGPGAKT